MKIMKTILKSFVAILFICSFASSYASIPADGDQPGSVVSGKVIDKNTGESLAGATVIIDNGAIKTYTDLEGNFNISNLSPGKHNIKVVYISYQIVELNDIQTIAGNTKYCEIAIQAE
jgi:hypothetical protein